MKRWERRVKRNLKQIARKYALLSRDPDQAHSTIHRARRLTKQLRAFLALLPDTAQSVIKKIVRRQRDIVRQLGLVRDEALFRENLKQLGTTLDQPLAVDIEPIDPQSLESLQLDLADQLTALSANVFRIQNRLQRVNVRPQRRDIARQLKRSCKKFIALQRPLSSDAPLESWHELRKAGKLLEYQLRFLRKYSRAAAGPVSELMIDIGKRLGHLNDFAKAQEAIETQASPMGYAVRLNPTSTKELLAEIAEGCQIEKEAALQLCETVNPLLQVMIDSKSRELIE
jgi:CHAD domain-containing protein